MSFISDYDMPMPMLDENTLDNLISKKESKNKDDGDAKYLKDMKVRMTGIENEMKVTDMFLRFLNMAKPMVIITQFQWKSFSNLFSPASGMDQEIDDVIILGEYSTVILLEIKSSGSFTSPWQNPSTGIMKFRFYFCFSFLLEITLSISLCFNFISQYL